MNAVAQTRRSSGVVALSALEALVASPRGVSLSELAGQLGVDPGQLHRSLNGLVAAGYAENDRDTHLYSPTTRVIAVAGLLLGSMDLVAMARPLMVDLRKRTGETVHLAHRTPTGAICVALEMSEHPVAYATQVGQQFGASSAVARALDEFPRRALDQRGLRAPVIDDGQGLPGVRCAAAPILNWQGEANAAVAVSGPAERIDVARLLELGELVAQVGHRLSSDFGGAGVDEQSAAHGREKEDEDDDTATVR